MEAPLNSIIDPNGNTIEIFWCTWDIIGKCFFRGIKHLYLVYKHFKIVKENVIALITKLPQAIQIGDFMLISLRWCPFLIQPTQKGFIKGRLSTYHVILVNEILREFSSRILEKLFMPCFI